MSALLTGIGNVIARLEADLAAEEARLAALGRGEGVAPNGWQRKHRLFLQLRAARDLRAAALALTNERKDSKGGHGA